MKILWYPKLYREILQDPAKILSKSTRARVYNFHQGIKDKPGIHSDVLGLTVRSFHPWQYDVLVIQKTIPSGMMALQLCMSPHVFVVQDLCDPIRAPVVQQIHKYADLIITSNHELSEDVARKGAGMPVATVTDNHDANPGRVKHHEAKEKLRVTWYGIGENYFQHIKPMIDVLSQDFLDFRWASSEDPRWNNEPGFQKGVQMELEPQVAWTRADSWQEFIFQSDVGVVPVTEHVKSPHKILNYMAYGIPVVCSPIDSHRRLIEHGKNGFLASSREEWIDCLRALRDPELRNRIGRKGRETALEAYSARSLAGLYLSTIESHLAKKKPALGALGSKVQYALAHLKRSSVSA